MIKIRKNLEEHISGNNYGLYNVNRRIYLLFGEGCGLTISSNENQGTIITMKLLKVMEE